MLWRPRGSYSSVIKKSLSKTSVTKRIAQASASCIKEARRLDQFGLAQQVHAPESFFCTQSARVFVVENDHPSLRLIVLESHGENLLNKGECLPAGLAFEWSRRPIGWARIVGIAD